MKKFIKCSKNHVRASTDNNSAVYTLVAVKDGKTLGFVNKHSGNYIRITKDEPVQFYDTFGKAAASGRKFTRGLQTGDVDVKVFEQSDSLTRPVEKYSYPDNQNIEIIPIQFDSDVRYCIAILDGTDHVMGYVRNIGSGRGERWIYGSAEPTTVYFTLSEATRMLNKVLDYVQELMLDGESYYYNDARDLGIHYEIQEI